jgi:hypothetical protein
MWMVDSTITAGWQAEIGFDYQVKTTQESFQNEQWVTHEKLEKRVRYEPRAGKLHRRYHNITAPALSDHERLMRRIGTYELQKAIPFQPVQVNRPIARTGYSPESAWPVAKENWRIGPLAIAAKLPGGSISEFPFAGQLY